MEVVSIQSLLDEGKTVKIGKNQIYKDRNLYIVEKYEYTTNNNVDMFSVQDGYKKLEKAIRVATLL